MTEKVTALDSKKTTYVATEMISSRSSRMLWNNSLLQLQKILQKE